MILLDEIEDGINPYCIQKAVVLLRKIIGTTKRQIIVTTHSPVILNDFSPEEIVYLWKADDGTVQCKTMFSTDEMMDTLEFLHPGEVWLNYSKDDVLKKMKVSYSVF
jgi:predicted ATPase